MPLYMCSQCGTVDNTALGGFWRQQLSALSTGESHKPLCSACDPTIAKWHGEWTQKSAEGYVQDRQGYLYLPAETERMKHMGPFKPVVLPIDGQSEASRNQ